MNELKIFIYKTKNGELIEEKQYSDFLFIFNNVISHNFLHENEEDKINIMVSTEFPPKGLTYNNNKQWESKKNIILKEYHSLMKLLE